MTELVVTMALMSIVAAALSSVIVAASNAEVRTNRNFQAQVQGRVALNKLRRELHCASAITVRNSSGSAVSAGTAGAQVAITLGGYCPTNGLTTNTSQSVYVTWCTSTSSAQTGRYALYRLASLSSQPACATSGTQWADYLTTSTPFCLPSTSVACSGVYKSATSLPTLHVGLPISLNTSTSSDLFNITDDIALRNGTRS
jgi:type II secretory pathway pseudopilin PulG